MCRFLRQTAYWPSDMLKAGFETYIQPVGFIIRHELSLTFFLGISKYFVLHTLLQMS